MPSTPPLDDKARRKAASEKNAKTDERFYAKLREENGGELPADMVGPDGQPRKLTNGPEDEKRRKQWFAAQAEVEQEDAAAAQVGAGDAGGVCQPCLEKQRAAKSKEKESEKKVVLRIFLSDATGKALSGISYSLEVDGAKVQPAGVTGGDGLVQEEVSEGCRSGLLCVEGHEWSLKFEEPPPHSEDRGVRVRIANLGLATDPSSIDDAGLDFALRSFQRSEGLDPSGTADDATSGRLDTMYT